MLCTVLRKIRLKDMFRVKDCNKITRIMMATDINGRVLYSVAAYLIDGLLIDTGCHNTRWDLYNFLRDQKICLAVNTHHHVDHVGGNRLLMDKLQVPVYATQECMSIISQKQDILSYQHELWGCPDPCQAKVLGDTVETDNYSFDVIQSAGHSKDHAVFFLKEKGWLFTGDEFLTEEPNSARKNENNKRIVRALKKLLNLGPELLITSSGRVYRDGSVVLKRTISYFDKMRDKVYAVRESGLTSNEIVNRLFGEEHPLKKYTGGQFSRQNFVEGFF